MVTKRDTGEFVRRVYLGDCRAVLTALPECSIAACITDPPYNYEFVGREWPHHEIARRLKRVGDHGSSTLVKNIPYGSGLAGGVRNARWYERNRQNVLDYEEWVLSWAEPLYQVCKPGAPVAVFSSTRSFAHVQVALERAGFYARDCLVYRRHAGIPRGLNAAKKLKANGDASWEEWRGWHSTLRNEWEAICLVQKPLKNDYLTTLRDFGIGLFRTETESGGFASNIIEGIPRESRSPSNVHCTPKPVALLERLIRMLVPEDADQVLLDPFAGSGSTLVAATRLGRSWLGIEVLDEYTQIIGHRLETETPLRRGSGSVEFVGIGRDEEEFPAQGGEPLPKVEAAS